MSKKVGAMRAKDAKMLPMGAFVEGELYLSWMHFFPSPFLPLFFFLFYSFICFSSSFSFHSRTNQGTLPWHGDQS